LAGENIKGHVPVALSGRVPTYFSGENGSVSVGDPLTTATKAGYAMKYDTANPQAAGLVGMALEPATADGLVTIMVNKGLLDGAAVTNLNVTQNDAGQLIGTADLNLAGYSILNVKGITGANGNWSINEDGNFVSKDIKADKAQLKQMVMEKSEDLVMAWFSALATQTGMTNQCLKDQGLLSVKELWVHIQ